LPDKETDLLKAPSSRIEDKKVAGDGIGDGSSKVRLLCKPPLDLAGRRP
jgi:hypothetical protein